MLPVLLQLSFFVDLVYGLGALIASPGHPVVLGWDEGTDWEYRAEVSDDIDSSIFDMICLLWRFWMGKYVNQSLKILKY